MPEKVLVAAGEWTLRVDLRLEVEVGVLVEAPPVLPGREVRAAAVASSRSVRRMSTGLSVRAARRGTAARGGPAGTRRGGGCGARALRTTTAAAAAGGWNGIPGASVGAAVRDRDVLKGARAGSEERAD